MEAAIHRAEAEVAALQSRVAEPAVIADHVKMREAFETLANAQHEVGHLARLEAIERALARHPGLFVTGSGFRGVGIPDCIADGRATARQAAQWLARHTDANREPPCPQ